MIGHHAVGAVRGEVLLLVLVGCYAGVGHQPVGALSSGVTAEPPPTTTTAAVAGTAAGTWGLTMLLEVADQQRQEEVCNPQTLWLRRL